MALPSINTAIPKRRYQLGLFQITVLGEVESDDPQQYRYIMGVAADGETQPGMCVSVEKPEAGEAGLAMRISMADGSQVIGHSEAWHDLDTFVEAALEVVVKMLKLDDEEPYRLL